MLSTQVRSVQVHGILWWRGVHLQDDLVGDDLTAVTVDAAVASLVGRDALAMRTQAAEGVGLIPLIAAAVTQQPCDEVIVRGALCVLVACHGDRRKMSLVRGK